MTDDEQFRLKLPGDILKTVERIEMDLRLPCRYNAAASMEFHGIAIMDCRLEPQVPFRVRRIIPDAADFWLMDIRVGVMGQLATCYELRIASEILMADNHPIEWGDDKPIVPTNARRERNGIDTCLPGMMLMMRVVNRSLKPRGLTVLLLGDALW